VNAPVTVNTGAQSVLVIFVAGLVLGAGGGLGFGWKFWRPKTVVETAAPAARQQDSSLILARVPDAHAKPAAIVPKGETVSRIDNVTVHPTVPVIVHDTIEVLAGPTREVVKVDTVQCPPVRVQLVLTDLPDGTHRVIASSPDGRVTGGLDIAVKNAVVPRVLRWSAGGIYASEARYGAYLGHTLGPSDIHSGAISGRGKTPAEAFVSVGLRF
jgi:hypothetical protein